MEMRPIQQPQEHEAIIKVDSNCISPLDFRIWNKISGFHPINKPSYTVGMCASGIVVKLGGIKNQSLKKGDRIVLEPGVCCLKCEYCQSGMTNLCKSMSYIGSEVREGSFATYITHPTNFCHKLDSNVSFEIATLIPRVACAIHSYERAQIGPNSKVLIIGSSLMGLIALLVYKQLGVGTILMAEASNYRLDIAKKLGASYAIKLAPVYSPEYPEYLKEVVYAIQSEEPNITVDTLGTKHSIELAIDMTKKGGKVIPMSFMSVPVEVPLLRSSWKEIDFIGSHSYTQTSFQKALKLVTKKYSSFEIIVPYKIPFSRAIDAFSYARAMAQEIVFILVKNEEDKEPKAFGFEDIRDFKGKEQETPPNDSKTLGKYKVVKNQINEEHTKSSVKSIKDEYISSNKTTDLTIEIKNNDAGAASTPKKPKLEHIGENQKRPKEEHWQSAIDSAKEKINQNNDGRSQVSKDNQFPNDTSIKENKSTTQEENKTKDRKNGINGKNK